MQRRVEEDNLAQKLKHHEYLIFIPLIPVK